MQLFQLASHSIRSVNPSLPRITPSALLVPLSTLYPQMLSISPGERVFIRPYSDPDVDRPPQSLWLNYCIAPATSIPQYFGAIEDTLLVQTQDHPHPMFQDAIPLGTSACVFLNPGMLPPPFIKPSRVLALLSDHSGGPGALQYHHHFHASGQKVALLDISLATHSLPPFFHDDLLNFEDWPDAATLFPQDIFSPPPKGDILTVSCPEFDTSPSPTHGLTWCNGLARSPDACTAGPSLSIQDWHHHTSDTTGVWECYPCHTPESAPLQLVLPHTIQGWKTLAPEHLPHDKFATPVLNAYLQHISSSPSGVAAWRFPPHSLSTATLSLFLRLFPCDELLLEGFGSGAYSVAVACNLAFQLKLFSSILTAMGGIAMHPNTLKTCIDHFVAAHLSYQELYSLYETTAALPIERRPKDLRPPSPKFVLIMAQHLHDRMAPWRLTDVLLAFLFNHGISVVTLHDDIQKQLDTATSQAITCIPKTKFGRYRHSYEWLLPSLKSFSPTTLLSIGHFNNFLKSFTYEELDRWEGAVSTPYSTDLQDLLYALLSLWGAPPLPSFAAQHDALGLVLVRGVHRFPEEHENRFHITRAPHDTPTSFYTRAFIHPLRFPALAALNLPPADIQAIEMATRTALLALPLLQALDFLHTQLLAGLCVSPLLTASLIL